MLAHVFVSRFLSVFQSFVCSTFFVFFFLLLLCSEIPENVLLDNYWRFHTMNFNSRESNFSLAVLETACYTRSAHTGFCQKHTASTAVGEQNPEAQWMILRIKPQHAKQSSGLSVCVVFPTMHSAILDRSLNTVRSDSTKARLTTGWIPPTCRTLKELWRNYFRH